MTRPELEDLAAEKDTTPENLLRLMNDQAWFEFIFDPTANYCVGVDLATGESFTTVIREPGQGE